MSTTHDLSLRERADLLDHVFGLGLIGMVITSPSTNIVEVNDEMCRILGYERDELLTKTWHELTDPADLGADLAQFDRVMAGEIDGYSLDKRWIHKDGRRIAGTLSVRCLRRDDGTVACFAAVVQDATLHRQAEAEIRTQNEELRRVHDDLEHRIIDRTQEFAAINDALLKEVADRRSTEERLREYEQCVEGLEEMIVVIDSSYRYLLANRAFLAYRGIERHELVGHSAPDLVDQEVWDRVARKKLDECLQGKVVKYELRYCYPGRSEKDLYVQYFPIEGPNGVDRVAAVLHDITDRKRAEAERTQILRRLLTAQEDERRRIARDMHDQFGQQLSALELQIRRLKRDYGQQPGLGEELQALDAIARQLDRDVDFFVWEMRPTVLDDLGLLVALEDYVKSWSSHFGVVADLHSTGVDWNRLPGELETVLYRVTQEALTNVAKHAKARTVSILLERRADAISLIVEDDGVGFDVEQVLGNGHSGLGLAGMRERVGLAGGTLHIESHAPSGVTVVVRIPEAAGQARSG